MANKIYFQKLRDAYGFFSNFYPSPFTVDGVVYKTSEHYYQSKKFLDPEISQEVIDSPGPWKAAELGRDRNSPLRDDWEEIKVEVMYDALMHKFLKYPEFVKGLLSTGDDEIIERSDKDDFWADGANGKGQNMLGKLLMRLRESLKLNAKEEKE